jgi:hypothetical protein
MPAERFSQEHIKPIKGLAGCGHPLGCVCEISLLPCVRRSGCVTGEHL